MSHDLGQHCRCVTEHRPKAVELDRHHIWPLYLGGPETADNLIWVCPNTHRATHELLRLYLKAGSPPPGSVLDDYPRMARDLAAEGYRRWKDSQ